MSIGFGAEMFYGKRQIMTDYEKAVALWQKKKIETDAQMAAR